MMFSDAEALLFHSAERALIDVESILVATNEMEEILQLLTERDIEHTNNPTPPHPAPTPTVPQTLTPLWCFSVYISSSVAFHRGLLLSDPSFYIFGKTSFPFVPSALINTSLIN